MSDQLASDLARHIEQLDHDGYTIVRDAFDMLYREGATQPKMMSIGMHCRLLGRPGRIVALQKFLDHVARHDKVWVARRIDIARHWKAHHPK